MLNLIAEFVVAVCAFIWGFTMGYSKGREDRGP